MIELPYDIGAESGIISTIIHHPEFILHSEYLKAGYFYKKENGCFYWAIYELYKAGIDKIDTFNLTTQLNSNKGVKNIIDSVNIPSIQDFVNLSKNIARSTIEEYKLLVNRVTALSFKRDLYNKIISYENACLDDKDTNIDKIYKNINDDLSNLTEQYIINENIPVLGNQIDDIWNKICSRRTASGIAGIPSKFNALNDYYTYEKTELVIVAAPRKTGKSMFMLNECLHKIENNVPTAYLDTEMDTISFTKRLLANLTQIPIKKIKDGTYSVSEDQMLKEAREYIKKKPFVHLYMPNWTNEKIYTTCKILQLKMNLQFVIFDYLKGSSLTASEQYNELGNKTNFLKNDIAGGLGLSVLAGAQLNRGNEIGDSYKIEQYASTVLNLKPKTNEEILQDGKECGNYFVAIKLNRNGEQQDVDNGEYIDLVFKGNLAIMDQALKQHVVQQPFG